MFTPKDKALLQEKQITEKEVEAQLKNFRQGFPFLHIVDAASLEKGIFSYSEDQQRAFLQCWSDYLNKDHNVLKFVPASGAASRMFKFLFEFLDADFEEPITDSEKRFFDKIHSFAFFDALNQKCIEKTKKTIKQLLDSGNFKIIVHYLLSEEGLNYGNLPKGLLLFHQYEFGARTPMEEHMIEGTMYAQKYNGKVNIHFTVSPEHRTLFEQLVSNKKSLLEKTHSVHYAISFSTQKPRTDTIAANIQDQPFREEDGSLLFRPGGHGALIENLNDVDADVIFIKNIDNIVPDTKKKEEAKYKQLLAGVLVSYQQKAFDYLDKLHSGNVSHETLTEILHFTKERLNIIPSATHFSDDKELQIYLKRKLNRPFRVCGMVKNVGEPGGGPFIVRNPDGTASPQILESSQINRNDEKAMAAFKNGSHFNPVDLVCGVKNWQGKAFDLIKYVDKNSGFISHKSKSGKELKALELPGLWNGAMSDWNTIFVEVPISTFNPVKTVNDLLRKEHQK